MAITLLVSTSAAASPTVNDPATTPAIDTTGASTIVIGVVGFNGAPGVSDGVNSWSGLTTYSSSNVSVRLFRCDSPTTSASHVFAASGAPAPAIIVFAFSGTAATSFDVENGASNNSAATIATGSVTPSENDEVLVTLLGSGAGPATIDSGFTLQEEVLGVGGLNLYLGAAYKIQTSAGAENPTWTYTPGANQLATAIATFKAAGAPPASGHTLAALGVGN